MSCRKLCSHEDQRESYLIMYVCIYVYHSIYEIMSGQAKGIKRQPKRLKASKILKRIDHFGWNAPSTTVMQMTQSLH